jgi:hypothetical protein
MAMSPGANADRKDGDDLEVIPANNSERPLTNGTNRSKSIGMSGNMNSSKLGHLRRGRESEGTPQRLALYSKTPGDQGSQRLAIPARALTFWRSTAEPLCMSGSIRHTGNQEIAQMRFDNIPG